MISKKIKVKHYRYSYHDFLGSWEGDLIHIFCYARRDHYVWHYGISHFFNTKVEHAYWHMFYDFLGSWQGTDLTAVYCYEHEHHYAWHYGVSHFFSTYKELEHFINLKDINI